MAEWQDCRIAGFEILQSILRFCDSAILRLCHPAMKLGLIAGNGRFPFLVLEAARAAGRDVTVIALQEETFPDLVELARQPPPADVHWISLGQLGKCISLLKRSGVTEARMAG